MPSERPDLDLELCLQASRTCTAGNLRRASRAVSGLFDDALRPTGLRISQFSILVALALAGEASVSRLAGSLDLERTTLTRNVGPLQREGLVASAEGTDARNRMLRLTDRGRATLARALPIWERVQGRITQGLGDARWRALLRHVEAAAALARPR